MKYIKVLGILFFHTFFSFNLFAQVKLPAIFSDNMILQQQSDVAVWGWANKGSLVTIVPSWDKKKYTVKADASGKWKTKINTPVAGGPYEISFTDGNVLKLSNVLIGEVWLCSGQSNMEMPMKGFKGTPVTGSNDLILKSANKNIRLFTVGRSAKVKPADDCKGKWQEASPETVSDFSATGYYFGKLVYELLNIPVGLINVSYGGSCIQAWMSRNTSQPFENAKVPQENDSVGVPNRTPTALFNGMLNPVIGFGIKGCIWYQGETNYREPEKYTSLFETMVKEWRSLWEIGDFPFYYAQIAPYNYSLLTPKEDYKKQYSAFLRDAQRKALKIPETGMAVLMDIGEEDNIHPADKESGGKRLAYLALAKTYHINGFGYASPLPDTLVIKGNTAVISFKNIPNGLTSFGKKLSCFEIAGEDKHFYPADAVLGRKSITVSAPEVKKPVAVRYAFKDFIRGDLFSTEGLPVSSFRTDDWEE